MRDLLVGLGNPGARYARSRHNIGFRVMDAYADSHSNGWKHDKQSHWIIQTPYLILKPQTLMNRSGLAVSSMVNFYKIPIQHVLLVYDDLDMAFGKIRFREKGSSGGHNGVKSICEVLGTETIARLKIGIGRPTTGHSPVDYVLSPFSSEEEAQLPEIIEKAWNKIQEWTCRQII